MKKFYSLLIVLAFFSLKVFGQTDSRHPTPLVAPTSTSRLKSEILRAERIAEINSLPLIDSIWTPSLIRQENSPNESENEDSLSLYKATGGEHKLFNNFGNIKEQQKESTNGILGIEPVIGTTFQGNLTGSCPNDNSMAISNAGTIVSCVNSNISIYNSTGTLQRSIDLYDFFNYFSFTLPTNICDPKVIYDPNADRFILFSQVCDGLSANSKLLVAFSKTNNPSGGWSLYWFTGNPLNDKSWFDYPRMGISNNEVYISGNLFKEAGGYNQSLIYQINKNDGYSGASSIRWQYWYDIDAQPFTLLPLSKGQIGSYGPGCYFIATAGGGGGSNLKFYHLTDDLTATNEQLKYYSVSTYPYKVAKNAHQYNTTQQLDVGDCRMMDGFYHNGVAHFTFMADTADWASIRYYRMPISTLAAQYFQTSFVGEFDYTYPALASFTNSATDQSALLVFLSSGANTYPSIRVKSFDNEWNTQASILVKTGTGYVNKCYNSGRNANRWGDYTGIARKYNSTIPRVWLGASYGSTNGSWSNWIAEIYSRTTPTKDIREDINTVIVAPNPVSQERFSVNFITDTNQELSFRILSMDGKLVSEIEKRKVILGNHNFSFNVGHLSSGIYILTISNNKNQIIRNEKIQISR
jgi:hypothetical protein